MSLFFVIIYSNMAINYSNNLVHSESFYKGLFNCFSVFAWSYFTSDGNNYTYTYKVEYLIYGDAMMAWCY